MVKFALDRDEEEGPSTRSDPKRRKRVIENETDGSEDNNEEEDNGFQPVAVESKPEESSGGILVTLTDPEVLDCSICMEPLSAPVFQCENGHIACSPCCTKLHNKCPSCSWPIGYSRCLAIEKVIESVKVSCGYKPYGCGETFNYARKQSHEETCMYAPCSCPIFHCDFCGSSKQLSLHFSNKHWSLARRFHYNCPFTVSFGKLDPYLVFQGEDDGILFVLNNQMELVGSAITVVCLVPSSSNGGFSYHLLSKRGCTSLRLESQTKCVKERSEASTRSSDFLLVPYDFYCSSGKLTLEVCIWSAGKSGLRASCARGGGVVL